MMMFMMVSTMMVVVVMMMFMMVSTMMVVMVMMMFMVVSTMMMVMMTMTFMMVSTMMVVVVMMMFITCFNYIRHNNSKDSSYLPNLARVSEDKFVLRPRENFSALVVASF